MDRDAFIGTLIKRLGREALPTSAPARDIIGAPDFYKQAPYGTNGLGAADRVARFQLELEALGGTSLIANSPAEVSDILRGVLSDLSPERIITWARHEFTGWSLDWLWDDSGAIAFYSADEDSPSTESLTPEESLTREESPSPETQSTAHTDDLRTTARFADIGITLADFAIANTGTLFMRATAARARSVSLLPSVHIALVRESQIVDRMGEALETFRTWPSNEVPSSLHFISGPSRSADIENDLSIGVHGPAAVYVIIWRERF